MTDAALVLARATASLPRAALGSWLLARTEAPFWLIANSQEPTASAWDYPVLARIVALALLLWVLGALLLSLRSGRKP